MTPEQRSKGTMRLVATGPVFGGLGGALVGIVLAVVSGVPGAGLIIFMISTILGTVGTTASAALTLLGRFVTRRAGGHRAWDALWSVAGPLVAWTVTYLIVFFRQTEWHPVVFVLSLTATSASVFLVALWSRSWFDRGVN